MDLEHLESTVNTLKFILHADFLLAGGRERIPENDWNQFLREAIATTFVHAVESFCDPASVETDPLALLWMRYLPDPQIEGFWKPLYSDIAKRLKIVEVLRSREGHFRRLDSLRILPDWFCNGNEEPLLPDTGDVYFSREYQEPDIEILEDLGLEKLNLDEMMHRLNRGLAKRPDGTSLLDDIPLDDDWHTYFTSFLEEMTRDEAVREEVEQLDIIPLDDGQWVSPASTESTPVYLPLLVDQDPVHIEIPDNLGIHKLHETACAVGERLNFYEKLRIVPCDPEEVINKILNAHRSGRGGKIHDFLTGFEILFWFGRPNQNDNFGQTQSLLAASDGMKLYRANFLFFPSDGRYDAQRLLECTPPDDLVGYGFLHDLYMKSQVRSMIRSEMTWETWLRTCKIMSYPPLKEQQNKGQTPMLNPVQKLIARDNPGNFVANLRAHWSESYSGEASKSVCDELANLPVLCHDDTNEPLKLTLLPTNEILVRAQQLGMRSRLPFLKLPENAFAQGSDPWLFLRQLGVICDVGYEFYLALLRSLKNSAERSPEQVATCSEIYAGIAECSKIGEAPVLKVGELTIFRIFADDATAIV